MNSKIYLHRLGCPKLDVDHDLLSSGLSDRGAVFVPEVEQADTVIISTCAFIADARAEAVEAMLEGAQWKEEVPGRRLFVTGCLPARYRDTLKKDLPEVDGWYGPGEFEGILAEFLPTDRQNIIAAPDKNAHPGRMNRELEDILSSIRHVEESPVAYLKIAEGCNRRCAYCAIPDIRGPYTSRRPGSILSEASRLLSQGVREIIVTAQEVNSYGRDLGDGTTIEALLPRLGELVAKSDGWLRVLYTHPPLFSEAFVQALADTPALVPYLDFPIEHADDSVLKVMGRGTTWSQMARWIDLLRKKIDRLALRTSIIVGHPGEGETEFRILMERLYDVRFERLGVFRYSPEEETRAAKLKAVDSSVAVDREMAVQDLAMEHADEWYAGIVGQELSVLLERARDEDGLLEGRSIWDAPDIDGNVIYTGSGKPGDIVRGRVEAAEPYEMTVGPDEL